MRVVSHAIPNLLYYYQVRLLEVERISATDKAFAALRLDRAVVAWGEPSYGGDTSAVTAELASGVVSVHG